MFNSNVGEKTQKSAINMMSYGINAVVLAAHDEMELIGAEFRNKSDSVWCCGLGKEFMYSMLQSNLKKEDAYFEKHKNKAKYGNQRWTKFCDDCTIFAVLSSVLHETPIMLVHPKCFDEIYNSASVQATNGAKPTIIEGISTIQ